MLSGVRPVLFGLLIFLTFLGGDASGGFRSDLSKTLPKVESYHQTAVVDQEDDKQIKSGIKFALVTDDEDTGNAICFDVDANNGIALGFDGLKGKTIKVYSLAMQFQYALVFELNGSFGIQWTDHNTIMVYPSKGQSALDVNSSGEIVAEKEFASSVENSIYRTYVILATKKECAGKQYILTNSIGALNWLSDSYSQLRVKTSEGRTEILYNNAWSDVFRLMGVFCLILIAFMIIWGFVISILKAQDRSNASQYSTQ